MQSLIDTATSTFNTTTGFTVSSVVDYAGGLVKLGIGTGLGVLQNLWPWILALVGIAVIVGLIRAVFRYFNH